MGSNVMTGKISSYNAVDGLGIVRLDDGREIRLTLTACGYMRPEVGKRVRVLSLTEGFEGRPKATLLQPEEEKA
jgi:cold shock CspA family protein